MNEGTIENAGAEHVTMVGYRNYIFTYAGNRYSARYTIHNRMWAVGLVIAGCVEVMCERHTLDRAVRDALADVDQINKLIGGV